MNFTAIDFETANRRRTSACSIGLAKVSNGRVTKTFYQLLNPKQEFEYINVAIHGISEEDVVGAPSLIEIWDDFILPFIDDDVLVAHNVSFEQSVINQTLEAESMPIPDLDYLCTLYMSRVNYPGRIGYRLPDLCKDLLKKNVNHHNALEDAIACAELGVHLISKFRQQDPKKLIEALYVTPVRSKPAWKSLKGIKASKEELNPDHPLFDKTFVITGILETMSRESLVRLLINFGCNYSESLNKKVNILIIGDGGYSQPPKDGLSSKHRKALENQQNGLDTVIYTESQFLEYLDGINFDSIDK